MTPSLNIAFTLPLASFDLKVDTSLPGQGVTVVYGPSGSGKTSFLRCVAGLEKPQQAQIKMGDVVWQSSSHSVFVPTYQRALGYVFQEGSLLEHLSAHENVQYGLKPNRFMAATTSAARITKKNLTQGSITNALDEAIELLGISSLLNRMPAQLSGGERQRVAIARAVARVLAYQTIQTIESSSSSLLLMDEPLASLDAQRRSEVLGWLERLRAHLKVPMLYVTHSTQELVRLADHLLVLQEGQQVACGPAQTVLSDPKMAHAMSGELGALVSGEITAIDQDWHLACVSFVGGKLWIKDEQFRLKQTIRLRLIASDIGLSAMAELSAEGQAEPSLSSIQNQLACVVESVHSDQHPAFKIVRMRCSDTILLARVTARAANQLGLQVGMPVAAQVKAVAVLS